MKKTNIILGVVIACFAIVAAIRIYWRETIFKYYF